MKDCVVAAVVALIVAASPVAAAPAGTELLHNSTSSWTERDGLPSAHIYAITQDAAGYLWLGTSTGVMQFDGVRFRLWDALQGTPYMATAALALLASRDGSFWVGFGSDQGLARWQNGRLITYSSQNGLPPGAVRSLFEDTQGTIWAGGIGMLARFRNERWEAFGSADGVSPSFVVNSFHEDALGTIWIGGYTGAMKYRPDAERLKPGPPNRPRGSWGAGAVRSGRPKAGV